MEWLIDLRASALYAVLYPFFWIWAWFTSGITVGKLFKLIFTASTLSYGFYFFGFWKTIIICALVLVVPRFLFPKLYDGN
jgi:hypothetical protein